jgi:hypothetical protein
MGDAENYTSVITKRRADIGQGILRTDIKRRAALGHGWKSWASMEGWCGLPI